MTWCPFAIRDDGPAFKQNGGVNTVQGVVMHSMVGSWAAARGELMKVDRRASWHFSVLQDGTIYQAYDPSVQAWHAGSAYNNTTVGIEHEGGLNPEDEPLTDAQLAASVKLVRWLSTTYGFAMTRPSPMYEHHEVSGAPTACPSGRIPWEHYTPAPKEETDMKPFLAWDTGRGTVYLVGPFGAAHVAYPSDKAAFEALYGVLAVALSSAAIDELNKP